MLLAVQFVRKPGARPMYITALDKVRKELAIMKKVLHASIVRCFEIIDDEDGDEVFMGAFISSSSSESARVRLGC